MIDRDLAPEVERASARAPCVAIAGPRRSGKATLCQALFPTHPRPTLEAPDVRAFAAADPPAFLARFPDGAVIGEVQRVPGLLAHLRRVVASDPVPGRWILTSSLDLSLLGSVGRPVAGQMEVLRLLPLTWNEVTRFRARSASLDDAMFSGGHPQIFAGNLDPSRWLSFYVADCIERQVRAISNIGDLAAFQRFMELCAGRSSELLNYSSLAADCGISQPTAKAWTGILETSFLTFRLPAFGADLGKRLVKAPKLYFHDTGLLCWLLGIRDPNQLRSHPLRGSIFETWVVSEIVKHRANRGLARGLRFYRDRNGAEADLVIEGPKGVTLVDVNMGAAPSRGLLSGVERVRRHFRGLPEPEIGVVYGGDGFRPRSLGRWFVPWWRVREAAVPAQPARIRPRCRGPR